MRKTEAKKKTNCKVRNRETMKKREDMREKDQANKSIRNEQLKSLAGIRNT